MLEKGKGLKRYRFIELTTEEKVQVRERIYGEVIDEGKAGELYTLHGEMEELSKLYYPICKKERIITRYGLELSPEERFIQRKYQELEKEVRNAPQIILRLARWVEEDRDVMCMSLTELFNNFRYEKEEEKEIDAIYDRLQLVIDDVISSKKNWKEDWMEE